MALACKAHPTTFARSTAVKAVPAPRVARSRQNTVVARAERSADSSFVSGFILGGIVCGGMAFLFAPQISRALLGDDQRLRLPRFLEEDEVKDPEATKQDLIEKIAQLNSSIDEVAAQLKTRETAEGESVAA